MKALNILALLLIAGLWACSDDSGIVESDLPENPASFASLTLSGYAFDTDTLNIPSVGDKNEDDPITISIDMSVQAYAPDGVEVSEIRVTVKPQGTGTAVADTILSATGSNLFAGTVSMHIARNDANDYEFLVSGIDSRGVDVSPAFATVKVLNGKYPPELSNLVAPDSIKLPATGSVSFVMAVDVNDPSGPEDIWRVYYNVIRPDGTSSGTLLSMTDNGENGDEVAGDGTYSAGAKLEAENTPGTYTFEFQAIDRSNLAANTIIHKIVVYK